MSVIRQMIIIPHCAGIGKRSPTTEPARSGSKTATEFLHDSHRPERLYWNTFEHGPKRRSKNLFQLQTRSRVSCREGLSGNPGRIDNHRRGNGFHRRGEFATDAAIKAAFAKFRSA
jgi:hypothetical protein